ncbi:MAG: alpha-1,2-fucosyltransferase [Bacteroidales bacterium]|nr:alpha-1,2-fucosyltransferase [Bacteroidales bacterium]
MVYTYLSGRLGNNLFQIATGAALAIKNNSEMIACISETWCAEPDNCYLEQYLEPFKHNVFRNIKFINGFPEGAIKFNQVEEVEQIPYYDNIFLHGLWQSENYFVKQKEYLQELFSIDKKTKNFITNKYPFLFEQEIISIVIRRGDYCKQPQYHPTCSMKYYRNAVKYFGNDKSYLIVSDDIEWCKAKFKGENFYFSGHESPVIDFYLQTLCTHNIISNSSFAWWGAWLNNNHGKKVIAPSENWCGLFYKDLCRSDLLPKDWILIANPLIFKHKLKVGIAIVMRYALLPMKHFVEGKFKLKLSLKKNNSN